MSGGIIIIVGCFLVAFSPALALISLILARENILLFIGIVSAGFWLVSFFCIAVLWHFNMKEPVLVISFGTLIQEMFRFALVISFRITSKTQINSQVEKIDALIPMNI